VVECQLFRKMNQKLYGNISGLSSREQKELERLYRRRVPPERITTHQLNRELCGLSHRLNKKIGLLLNRRGTVEFVVVGDEPLIRLGELKKRLVPPTQLRELRTGL